MKADIAKTVRSATPLSVVQPADTRSLPYSEDAEKGFFVPLFFHWEK